ncbi:MAG: TVP38/TMEM64 family protein [Cyanobacteria bacterium P01_F01_bin.53]
MQHSSLNPISQQPASSLAGFWMALPILTALALVIALLLNPHTHQLINPDHLSATIEQAGLWGPLLYIAIITVSVVVSQIPGAPLAIAAGAIWDPMFAGLYTVIGGFGGALIAYVLGNRMGQPLIKALTGKTLSFSTEKGKTYLGWLIFTTRLLPVFSFDLVSYGAGMSGLSLPVYASATFFGMVPSTLLLTHLGNSFQLSGWAMGAVAAAFLILFIAIPAVMHRYNWLNTQEMIRWE